MKLTLLDQLSRYIIHKASRGVKSSTLTTQEARLRRLIKRGLLFDSPDRLAEHWKDAPACSFVVGWQYVESFFKWCHPRAANKYEKFRQEHKHLFKVKPGEMRREPKVTSWEEAFRILTTTKSLPLPARNKSLVLLCTGMRFNDSELIDEDMMVSGGKSARNREIYALPQLKALGIDPRECVGIVPSWKLRDLLAPLDLRPHDLRHLYAEKLARSGKINELQLCRIMGWENIATAKWYVNRVLDDEAKRILDGIFGKVTV